MNRMMTGFSRGGSADRDSGPLFVQRKCACGRETSQPGGECDECTRRRRLGIQVKLVVGESGDTYEREADRVSEEVTSAVPGAARQPALMAASVQRAPMNRVLAPASVAGTLSRSGRPLDPAVRLAMEARFARSFGDVQVHADREAADSAEALGARAYTHGTHVVFAAGEYCPNSRGGMRLIAHELAHVVQQGGDAAAPIRRDLAIEPQGVTKTERKLSEQDIKTAVAINMAQVKDKGTLRAIRDVVGVPKEPAVSDRDLALAVGRFQASHGVAQDGQLGPTTMMLLVEEMQAESDLVPAQATQAEELKKTFAKGVVLDIDASLCGCKPALEQEVKGADRMITEYTACGADPKIKTGPDVETCVNASIAAKGGTLTTLGSTSATGAITVTSARTGPCKELMRRIDRAHEQIHSVHTGELQQKHGAGTSAFTKAFQDKKDWVDDEVNSRNTDKSLSRWALTVLERNCP